MMEQQKTTTRHHRSWGGTITSEYMIQNDNTTSGSIVPSMMEMFFMNEASNGTLNNTIQTILQFIQKYCTLQYEQLLQQQQQQRNHHHQYSANQDDHADTNLNDALTQTTTRSSLLRYLRLYLSRIQQTWKKIIKSVPIYVLQKVSSILNQYSIEIQYIFIFIIESITLHSTVYTSRFGELLYGGKRVKLRTSSTKTKSTPPTKSSTTPPTTTTQQQSQQQATTTYHQLVPLSFHDKMKLAILVTFGPYLRIKLQLWYDQYKKTKKKQQQRNDLNQHPIIFSGATPFRTSTSRTDIVGDTKNNKWIYRLYSIFTNSKVSVKLFELLEKFKLQQQDYEHHHHHQDHSSIQRIKMTILLEIIFRLYPYVTIFIDTMSWWYKYQYLLGRTYHYDLYSVFLSHIVRRMTQEDYHHHHDQNVKDTTIQQKTPTNSDDRTLNSTKIQQPQPQPQLASPESSLLTGNNVTTSTTSTIQGMDDKHITTNPFLSKIMRQRLPILYVTTTCLYLVSYVTQIRHEWEQLRLEQRQEQEQQHRRQLLELHQQRQRKHKQQEEQQRSSVYEVDFVSKHLDEKKNDDDDDSTSIVSSSSSSDSSNEKLILPPPPIQQRIPSVHRTNHQHRYIHDPTIDTTSSFFTLCPICQRERVHPTVFIPTGYVFCLVCIKKYLHDENNNGTISCPVTGRRISINCNNSKHESHYLLRLYEPISKQQTKKNKVT